MLLDYFSLPCPLDLVCRSPTHACLRTILCLIPAIPVCYCLTLPVSTMFSNKALRMDPHVSRLVNPITEYSAQRGSSGFSKELWPSMDTTTLLFALKQGTRSLEDHIQYFLAIVDYSDLPDIVLMEVFCDGINQPLRLGLDSKAHVHHSVSF